MGALCSGDTTGSTRSRFTSSLVSARYFVGSTRADRPTPTRTPTKHKTRSLWWRNPIATTSRAVKEWGRCPGMFMISFIVSPKVFRDPDLSNEPFLALRNGQRQISTHAQIRDITVDLRHHILRHEHHVAAVQKRILSQVSVLLHLLHVDQLGLGPLIVHPAKQQNLRVLGAGLKTTSNRDRLGQRHLPVHIVLARLSHLTVGHEIRFFEFLQHH